MIRDARWLLKAVGARRLAAVVVGCAAVGALTASLITAHLTTSPKEND